MKNIIIMGVSGSGKTFLGRRLAIQLNVPYYDADDFHSEANLEKMKNGVPLTTQDRIPWLKSLALHLRKWEGEGGCVLACSALKESYRKQLSYSTEVRWVVLTGSFETIYERMQKRNHFMQPALLQSQFDALEVPAYGIHVDISVPAANAIEEILKKIDHNE